MTFTGDLIDAESALACGLVSKLVSGERLLSEARSHAERIVANPPQAVRLAKRLLRESHHARLDDMLELSATFQALLQESEDHAEALAAAIDKRAPTFTGK